MLAGDVYKLLEGTADAAFVVSSEGEICFWNHAAEQLFGYSAKEVLNQPCDQVLRGRDTWGSLVCIGDSSVQHYAADGRQIATFDLEVSTRSGKRIWVGVSTLLFEDSRLHRQYIAHLAHDITECKRVEQAFSRMVNLSKEVIAAGGRNADLAPVGRLSEQELRILKLFAETKSSKQVAKELKITLPTLRNHLHAINQKLRTHNRLEAVLRAMKQNLI